MDVRAVSKRTDEEQPANSKPAFGSRKSSHETTQNKEDSDLMMNE